jgi:hypothetical protein
MTQNLTPEMSKKGYIKCNNCGEVFKPEELETEKFYLFNDIEKFTDNKKIIDRFKIEFNKNENPNKNNFCTNKCYNLYHWNKFYDFVASKVNEKDIFGDKTPNFYTDEDKKEFEKVMNESKEYIEKNL